MTREEAKEYLINLSYKLGTMAVEYLNEKDGEKMRDAIKALEQEPTTKNDLGVDCVARQDVERYIEGFVNEYTSDEELQFINLELYGLKHIPSVTPQEPRCKECKWWKDSDGEYRRGVNAESQCPINRKEVYEGNGYCYLYEPQESEEV